PPVDVTQAQLHDIPRPQPEAGQQEENRAIAPTDGRCVIARGDHALDLRRLEVPRQGTEPPVGDGGDRGVEAHGTVAAGNQEAQEHAKSRRATLGAAQPELRVFSKTNARSWWTSQRLGASPSW